MNNLKKVLALGLALIMLMGMFTVVSAAKDEKMIASDLTDWDTVAHKDAVALMVDLGIINGMPDGSFAPDGNIDRASWAKMVYFAKTGSDDADAYLGTATGLNDIAGNWAESYISYLKANEYISGDNYGNYNPSNNVTVAEACKMMLTILGYDAEDRHYQNSATWSGNIMTDAKRYGLMDNVDRTQTALAPLTRENAAQIVYNAMSANTVDKTVQWDGGVQHVTGYYIDQTLGFATFGIVPVPVKVNDIDGNGNAVVAAVQDDPNNISNSLYRSVKGVKASPSQVGEDAIVWVEVTKATYDDKTGDLLSATGYVKTISSTVARGNSAADVTLTQGFRWLDLCNSAKPNYVADNFAGVVPASDGTLPACNTAAGLGSVQIYINGVLNGGKASADAARGEIEKVVWSNVDEELPGAVVEFYLNDKGEIATVRAYIYNVAQMDGNVETRTSSNGTLQVRLPGIQAGTTNLSTWKDADKVTGYQGLVDDDVVLFYEGSNNTYVVEKAEKITGVVTGRNTSKQITVNGTKYKRTAMANAQPAYGNGVSTPDGKSPNQMDFSNWYNREDEFAFYLDKTGAVCFTEQITETLSKSNIALVMGAEWNGTSMSVATGKLQAKLLFMDGTQEIVDVSKVEGLEVVTTLSTTESVKAKQIQGAPTGTTGVISGLDDNTAKDGNGNVYAIAQLATANYKETGAAFYNYRVVDGKYELTKVVAVAGGKTEDEWAATNTISGAHIEKKADFANGKAGYTANNKTVFLVAKGEGDDKTFYTYTGHTNIPEMKSANGLAVGTCESGAAKYVFLDTEAYSDDVPDGYVFVINNKGEDDPNNEDCYLINIVDAKGDVTTLSVREDIMTAIKAENTKTFVNGYIDTKYVGHFCTVDDIDENGVVSTLTPVTGLKPITTLGAGVVEDMNYDKVTKFVFVDMSVNDGDNADGAGDDFLEFTGTGVFDPDTFWNPASVDSDHTPGTDISGAATASFAQVLMGVISADNEIADYVYVLRVVW